MTRDEAAALLAPGGELELLGRNEAAQMIGTKPSNLMGLVDLPKSIVTHLRNRPLWLASEVREFAAERQRRPR